ncbi:VanZ family protein [Maricaulis sp. CAU 1757]
MFVTALLVITDLALQPGYNTPPRLFGSDKLEHVGAFALLAGLASQGWPRRREWIIAPLLGLYGIGIELLQATPQVGRTASLADVAADLVGIGLGLLTGALVRRLLRT